MHLTAYLSGSPPTEPGWYMAIFKEEPHEGVQFVRVTHDSFYRTGLGVLVIGRSGTHPLSDFDHWTHRVKFIVVPNESPQTSAV